MKRRGFLKSLCVAAATLTVELQPLKVFAGDDFGAVSLSGVYEEAILATQKYFVEKITDQIFTANPLALYLKTNPSPPQP